MGELLDVATREEGDVDDRVGGLRHVPRGVLSSDTGQTLGMQRREAISGRRTGARDLWMGESRMLPGAQSGNHHHGESETAIYVLSGHPVFVFCEGDRERRIETSPGDYVFVPAFAPHREENPSGEEAAVILARSTQEAIVVNLSRLVATEAGESSSGA